MNLRRLLGTLALLCCTMQALASDFVTERAWVEDPAGTMTLAEAQQAPEALLDSQYFTRGFSQSTFWLRLRIDPNADPTAVAGQRLIIRIRPPIQDQIQLFDPLEKTDRVRLTGDYFDWENDEYRSLNLNYVIPVGQKPRDVWLRLRTNQSTMTAIEVMTEDEVRTADRRQELATMLYFAVLIVCMGWGLLSYINQPDRLVGIYVIREIVAIVYALVMLGYFRVFASGWLPAAWLDPISNNVVFVFVAYVIWFDSQLIRQFKPNRWLLQATVALLYAWPVLCLLQILGRPDLAIVLNGYVVLVAIFLVFFTALSTSAWSHASARPPEQKPVFSKAFLVSVYSLVVIVTLANRLPIMGWIVPAQEGALYLNLLYALLSSVSMMALVQIRAYRLNKRQQDALHHTELAQREAEAERARRLEQSNFLKMLAHEMKTPLSVVRMAVGNAQIPDRAHRMIDRAITDMNGVIERLLEVERLEDQQLVLQITECDIAVMLRKLVDDASEKTTVVLNAPQSLIAQTDSRFVQIILSNLLDNAIKYGAVGCPVQVRLWRSNDQMHLNVSNVIGTVGAPDPDKIFDKYYRAPRAHERTGSGLGLYLCRCLATLLDGEMHYHQQADTVSFEVCLPMCSNRQAPN